MPGGSNGGADPGRKEKGITMGKGLLCARTSLPFPYEPSRWVGMQAGRHVLVNIFQPVRGAGEAQCLVSGDFHDVNTPTTTDSKLPA